MANTRPDGEGATDPSPANVERLHDQRDWLRVTLSCIGDAVITTDADGRVTFLNPVAESLTGWAPQEAVGQPLDGVFRLINEESRQPVESPSVRAFREGRTFELASHSLLVARDGTERPLDDSAAPISNDKGEVAGVVLVFRDVTERRKTERALEKALAYTDDIIATLREPFLVLNVDLRVKTANRAFYDSFHVSKAETENRLVYDLGNGQWDIPALRTLLDEVLSRNQSVHDFEVEHTFQSLGRKTMLLNARPFPPDSKHPELILLAVEDVSALRERADELAKVSRHKDEFLAMLSHELRNPLAPIRNAAQVIRLVGPVDANLQRAAQMIERQVGQMTCLVDDLLEVSRISSGKVRLQMEPVELAAVVARAVETSRPLIDGRRHELTVTSCPGPVCVDGDVTRLVQVVANLLNNAAKYTGEGGHIALTVERKGGQGVVRVRDDGMGIAADVLPHVFVLFTQGDRSLARSEGGLGIGLSLVKNLVELHGGRVEAFSDGPGKGSEFVVQLPALETQPVAPVDAGEVTANGTPVLPRSVLVVDDNVDSAESLAMLLRLEGHEVQTAYDGPTALATAYAFQPEVAFVDIGLPGMDGFELARRLREQVGLKDALLAALTGYGQQEDRRKSLEAGFDAHLVKPVDLTAVSKLLARPRSVK